MNKKEFVKAVSAEGGLSLSDATRAVEAMIEVVTYAMSKSEKIVLNEKLSLMVLELSESRNARRIRAAIPVQEK